MNDTIKMPCGGYDIKVVRKEEIIECIDANIVDKDVMMAFITQIEVDSVNFLQQGRWTSLPYMGTLRKNKYKEITRSQEYKELNEVAQETLDKDKYILFRKNLRNDVARKIKRERFFNYVVSQFYTKNKDYYKYIESTKGEKYARIISYSLFDIKTYNSYELQADDR